MRIGILTGGGDCPGLNPAIRAIVRTAISYGYEAYGIQRGWQGLIEGLVEPLALWSVSGILTQGGTILGTSRTNPAKIEKGYETVVKTLEEHHIDVLIAIGGDDTLSVANELASRNVPIVGIPKTIDNDVGCTDFCIGFDSAVAIVTDALDKLHTTASSHHRAIIVEVMGREAGWVALYGGLAGGADWILLPEVPSTMEEVCAHLNRRRQLGKDFSIIVVAEGVELPDIHLKDDSVTDEFGHIRLDHRNIGFKIGKKIELVTGIETRNVVLGHLQRGGTPTVFDRILATRLGVEAVKLIKSGQYGNMVSFTNNRIDKIPLAEVIKNSPRYVPQELYELAKIFY
jgi:phosphofructokinase-like protein